MIESDFRLFVFFDFFFFNNLVDGLCNMVGPYGGGETLFSYIKKTQRQLQVKDIDAVSEYLKV